MTEDGWTAWEPDVGLLTEVKQQFNKAIESYRIHPDLVSEHANLEESIRTGGYANRTLLELVQNAADALAGASNTASPDAGRVEIVLDPTTRTLYCANTGRPFSRPGITAITMAHLSGKRGDEIGRFGLGFKSVLAVSQAPQVLSRSIAFGFNSAEARSALSTVAGSLKRYPVLRTATPIDAAEEIGSDPVLAELAAWATTIVKLPAAANIDKLRSEIQNFRSEFLLFVHAVREIRLRVLGPEPFETTHVSRDLGDGRLRIERPNGDDDEWIVLERMHESSNAARQEVGEAVSRERVKVTVALPTERSRLRIGEFWSYFPLQDETTASALFNAPWSVNDDRTTLLRNDYNRDILRTLAGMFVDLLPSVATSADPAAHLDYMPARGRETLSFGDELLSTHVPNIAGRKKLVPDATADPQSPSDLRPLDFAVEFRADIHRAWCASPNTRDDVPHWKCYSNAQRVARLRTLFITSFDAQFAGSNRDDKRALERIPQQGVKSWLLEWAEGDDVTSAEHALKVVSGNPKIAGIREARVVPTNNGMRSLLEKDIVFLRRAPGLSMDGSSFVDPRFLARPGVENLLKTAGFRDLDPESILNARIAQLSDRPSDEELTRLWDAALEVPQSTGLKLMKGQGDRVRVPTRDGGWSPPAIVYDVDELASTFPNHVLDRHRCLPQLAHALGVVIGPIKNMSLDDEPGHQKYVEAIVAQLNEDLSPGELPISRVELYPDSGPGPFSILSMLADACAPVEVREKWTSGLLQHADQQWTCEDLDTNRTFHVDAPAVWAARRFGLLKTERGYRPPDAVVAPSLLRYQGLLPLLRGNAQIARALDLPDELAEVPDAVFRTALGEGLYPSRLDDSVVVEFVLAASRQAYAGTRPPSIPARVQKAMESLPPASVFLATDEEQATFLANRQRPFLRVTPENVEPLVSEVGCRRFEDSFTFSMQIDGRQASERIVDLYPGLRTARGAERVDNATLTRVGLLAKRVMTTGGGYEDQALQWHLDGLSLFVEQQADEDECLYLVNEAFGLHLDNAELSQIKHVGLTHRLELLRNEAQAASDDAARLAVYIGDDDLREGLPSGLWSALENQKLVNASTSVAELFLTVWGSDSLKQVQEKFRDLGYPDVPTEWAGRSPTISWLRRMGFGSEYAGQRDQHQDQEFVVPGAVRLNGLHSFQKVISEQLRDVIVTPHSDNRRRKAMVELPTGAGKTRVASETVLRLFIEGKLEGPVLWIAQSQELCEQAVQTFSMVWRGLGDERPMTICRLWNTNVVHEPDTEFSVVVATDAKLNSIAGSGEYEWLSNASLVIVDEGHRAGDSPMYTKILNWLGIAGTGWERPLIGLSATPFKGTSNSGTVSLAKRFGNHIIRAFDGDAYQELAALGVLARVKHDVLDGVKVDLSAGEASEVRRMRRINPAVLDRVGRDQARMGILVDHIMNLDPSWPVLVFTPSVLSAQVLAASLRYRNVVAESVSGQTSRQQRRDVIQRFKDGHVRVLANCDLLIQGFDAPGVRALYIARPTFSPNAYIQMAGRGLRGPENGGKVECLIVDMADDFGDMTKYLGYREYEPLWREQQ